MGTSVGIRTDSSALIGSGHLMRCLALAEALRQRGASVTFIAREHEGHLTDRAEQQGFNALRLRAPQGTGGLSGYAHWLGASQAQDAAETVAAAGRACFDWLIVDHYALDAEWEVAVGDVAERIFAIDDLANRPHECKLLLDQGFYGVVGSERYEGLLSGGTATLMGPRYALLKAEFAELRSTLAPRAGPVRRVLVFFGSSDAADQTSKCVEALCRGDLDFLYVDVVVGPNHPNAKRIEELAAARPNLNLHHSLPSLAPLLAAADLALGAGGMNVWERACLGLASIAIVIAENQRGSTEALARAKCHLMLQGGNETTAEEWHQAVVSLVADPSAACELAANAWNLTDGLGAGRVARVMLGAAGAELSLRRAVPNDEHLFLEWANDPDVRAYSFSPARIAADAHAAWFRRRLGDPDSLMLVAQDDCGLPVGQVRFDIDRVKREAVIDISVDRAFRGSGFGDVLLRCGVAELRRLDATLTPVAQVKQGNERSEKLFARAGFRARGSPRAGATRLELAE